MITRRQTGLRLFDQAGRVVYSSTVPTHVYRTFDDPALSVADVAVY